MTSFVSKALVPACLFAAVAATAVASSSAPPRWLAARDLSERGADSVIPDVAVDAKGNVEVVWAQVKSSSWTVQAVHRPAGGPWSAPQALSVPPSHVTSPEVAIAGTHVVAVWLRSDGQHLIVQTADRDPATGAWTTAVSLSASGPDAQTPQIAVDARGDEVAVWASVDLSGWTTLAAFRRAGGPWQPAVALEPPEPGTAAPQVVIDPLGNATVVWAATSGSGWRVHTSYRGATGTWSKAFALSGPDASGLIAPQLALESTDDVTAVWSRSIETGTVIELATRNAAAGTWSNPGQLSPNGPDALAPQIAVNKRGDGVIVWTSSDKSGLAIVASIRRPGKAWGAPTTVSSAVTGPLSPQLALDALGNALVVWSHPIGNHARVQASGLPAGGTYWSPARTLSSPGADALTPRPALDADGDGAVTWVRYGGQSGVVQGVGYDRNGPELKKLSMPAAGLVGRRLSFTVSPLDVWSAVRTVRWTFGDGAGGSGKLTGHTYNRPGRYAARVTATDAVGHVTSVRRWITIAE